MVKGSSSAEAVMGDLPKILYKSFILLKQRIFVRG